MTIICGYLPYAACAGNEKIMQQFVLNSARLGTKELDPILKCIKEAHVNVVLPINERDNEGKSVQTVSFM